MKEKELTAVEWLYQEIGKDRVGKAIIMTFFKEFKQAKEIEKEQIIESFYKGEFLQGCNGNGEDYYNETYKRAN